MRQAAQAYAQEADFAAMVTMLAKKILEDSEDVGVKLRWLAERFRARVGIEAGVTDGESEGARGEACFTQALAGFLREMAEHGGACNGVLGVFAESVIWRNGFRLRIDYEFVGIAP